MQHKIKHNHISVARTKPTRYKYKQ